MGFLSAAGLLRCSVTAVEVTCPPLEFRWPPGSIWGIGQRCRDAARHGISSRISAGRRIPPLKAVGTAICSENRRLSDRYFVDRTGRAGGLATATQIGRSEDPWGASAGRMSSLAETSGLQPTRQGVMTIFPAVRPSSRHLI